MLIDLLSSSNQITFNSLVAQKLGLHPAVYISEILAINEKALRKGKFKTQGNRDFFTIDREYIKKRITISEFEQRQIDSYLSNVGIVCISPESLDVIAIDVNALALILGAELDRKAADELIKMARKQTKEDKIELRNKGAVYHARQHIKTSNEALKVALYDWIDDTVQRYGYTNNTIVDKVLKQLDDFAGEDDNLKLEIVRLNPNGYNTMEYAIEKYKKLHPNFNSNAGKEVAENRVVKLEGEVF